MIIPSPFWTALSLLTFCQITISAVYGVWSSICRTTSKLKKSGFPITPSVFLFPPIRRSSWKPSWNIYKIVNNIRLFFSIRILNLLPRSPVNFAVIFDHIDSKPPIFQWKKAVFLQFVILEQIILHFHSFHKYFNHFILSSEDFSTQIVTKIEKRLFFPTKTAFYVWKTPWRTWNFRQKKSQATGLRANEKRRNDDKGGGIDRKQYNTVSCHLLYHRRS